MGSDWLGQSDGELLAQCEVDVYRASGPGGQHRNKTSSAVRLRHKPSGLMVIAEESRSQHENRARALRRLRQAIALHDRKSIGHAEPPPECFTEALRRDPTLRVSLKHPDYYMIVQYLLDVLVASQASVGDAATSMNISTGNLIRFLKKDPKLWAQANEIRREFKQRPLR